MRAYTELPDLAEVVLEESWVLGIGAAYRELALRLELCVTKRHPRYRPAAADEIFAAVPGALLFGHVSSLVWSNQVGPPAFDATGEIDYGHVDVMTFDGNRYHLEGDFGVIDLEAEAFALHLDPEDP